MELEIEALKNELDELNKELINLSTYNLVDLEINHRKFGVGKIIEQNGFNIKVKFTNENKNLQLPFIFINNIVECKDKDVLDKMKEISELQNNIINIEKGIRIKEMELVEKKESSYKSDSKLNLFVVTTGTSFDDVVNMNVYYCKANRCKKICDYLGLYNNKSIIKIGKIKKIIEAEVINENLITDLIFGEQVTEEEIEIIKKCIERGVQLFNCNIGDQKHKYFFVDKFYDTDYKKTTPSGLMEHKYFDLYDRLGIQDMPNTEELANALRDIEW